MSTPAKGVTVLFGHSGSGKTSILRAIAGLIRSQQGEVIFNYQVWQNSDTFIPTYQRHIGYVFQETSLFLHLSVHQKFDDVVDLLGITGLLSRSTQSLSGGERQRVAIARALLTSPELLLMDEPLSALDHKAKREILPYLESLHDELAIPSLYVTHDPNEVARLADYMILLDEGKIIASGLATDLLTRLDLPLATYEGAASILNGTVSKHDLDFHLTWLDLVCNTDHPSHISPNELKTNSQYGKIAISREDLPIGSVARVQIQARDVSLSLQPHMDTSILNILPVVVVDTHELNLSQLIVRLQSVGGQILLARITHRSAMILDLKQGMSVFAQVKSVHLLVKVPPKVSISKLMGTVKERTALQVFKQFSYLKPKPYWGNHFWAKGYCVDTVGIDAEMIRKYVKYQEAQERQLELDLN